MGMVPTISVEKTDGCQMYLSKEAAEKTEIITAKSSEMNVLAPNPQVPYFFTAISNFITTEQDRPCANKVNSIQWYFQPHFSF